jgi:hypothetical protein
VLLGEPGLGGLVLAGWTMPVATRVVAVRVVAVAGDLTERAGVDMAAKRLGSARFDRLHGLKLACGQRVAKARDRLAHSGGRSRQAWSSHASRERIEHPAGQFLSLLAQMRVDRRGGRPTMAEPKLDDAQIDASLKQMGGPRVAQGVNTGRFRHASCLASLLKGTPHTGGGYRHPGSVRIPVGTGSSWKEPERIAMGEPLATK